MDRAATGREPSRRLLAAVIAVACAGALLSAAPRASAAGLQQEPGVAQERERLRAAEQRRDAADVDLDAAAAAYEHAQAHQLRLRDELRGADATLQDARGHVATAEQDVRQRVAAVYKHPEVGLLLSQSVLLSADAPAALHRAALMRRVVAGSVVAVDDAEDAGALVVDRVTQQRVVAAGSSTAAAALRLRAAELTAQLERANAAVTGARDGVAAARAAAAARRAARRAAVARRAAAAARRQAAREQAEARRRAAALTAATATVATPLPAAAAPAAAVAGGSTPSLVDGKTCPVGTPNGFIDSWGFPRAGGRTHEGVDIFAAHATPLYAVADGVVTSVYNNTLGGLAINLVDRNGDKYYYAHLSAASAVSGQAVRAGDVIGAVGTSGNAAGTPPHLHWQYHPGGGDAVNPYPLAVALCR